MQLQTFDQAGVSQGITEMNNYAVSGPFISDTVDASKDGHAVCGENLGHEDPAQRVFHVCASDGVLIVQNLPAI